MTSAAPANVASGVTPAVSSDVDAAAAALARGEAVVFPTDTVYGLGVSVEAARTPRLLYDIKGRDDGKPIAWLVGGLEDLAAYGSDVPAYARAFARAFWPGALTLIVKASGAVPPAFLPESGAIGLRMPNHRTALQLIAKTGSPLAVTSANLSGEPATCVAEGLSEQLMQRVGCAVLERPESPQPSELSDSPESSRVSGTASTVVDCTGLEPRIIREGPVTSKDLKEALWQG